MGLHIPLLRQDYELMNENVLIVEEMLELVIPFLRLFSKWMDIWLDKLILLFEGRPKDRITLSVPTVNKCR